MLSCGELSREDLTSSSFQAFSDTAKALALQTSYGRNRSQLNVIFDVIGTPSQEDLPYLDSDTAALLNQLPKREGQVFLYCIHGERSENL